MGLDPRCGGGGIQGEHRENDKLMEERARACLLIIVSPTIRSVGDWEIKINECDDGEWWWEDIPADLLIYTNSCQLLISYNCRFKKWPQGHLELAPEWLPLAGEWTWQVMRGYWGLAKPLRYGMVVVERRVAWIAIVTHHKLGAQRKYVEIFFLRVHKLMQTPVQLEVFVRTVKTFPCFLGADLNFSSKFLPMTSKKLVDFSKICSDWPHQASPPIFGGPTL